MIFAPMIVTAIPLMPVPHANLGSMCVRAVQVITALIAKSLHATTTAMAVADSTVPAPGRMNAHASQDMRILLIMMGPLALPTVL